MNASTTLRMKCFSVFLLSAAAVCAADFATGQAARAVIGQVTFTDEDPNSSDTVLGGISGLAFAADTLFVADANRVGALNSNHRVLLFQGISSQVPTPAAELPPTAGLSAGSQCPVCVGQATVVLGQPDFSTNTLNPAATRSNLRLPTSVASDGVHLVVADTDHNRVLIWNRIPTTNDAPADVVVGQPDFVSVGVPSNHVPTAKSMSGPQGVWIQNGMLYVADTQNNRVLVYNHIPTTNGVAADVVLGQPNFSTYVEVDITAQTTSATATNMLNPVAVTSDGQRLFVADLGYDRVLIWNTIPTSNGAAADVAVGQPDLVSSIANNAYTVDANNNNKQTRGALYRFQRDRRQWEPHIPGLLQLHAELSALRAGGGRPAVHRRWRQRPRAGFQRHPDPKRRLGGHHHRTDRRQRKPGFECGRFPADSHVAGLGRRQPVRERRL